MTGRKRRKIFFNILILSLVIFTIIFLKNYGGKFNYLHNLSLFYFVVLSLFSWVSAFINGLRVKVFANIFNIDLSFKEWFGLSQVTTMGNYLTPFRGGSSLKAIYLKKNYKFPYKTFIVTMGATILIAFLVYGLLGISSLLYSFLFTNIFNNILFLVFLAVLIFSLIIVVFPQKVFYNFFKKGVISDNLRKLIDGWSSIKKHPINIIKIFIIEALSVVTFSFTIFFGFKAVNYSFPFVYCLIIAIISNISVVFNLTPAGLGVREAVTVWSSSLFGAGVVIPLNVAILVRLIAIIWILPLGLFFSYVLFKE